MSGTSSDGVDAVLVRLKGAGDNLAMKLMAYEHLPYGQTLRTRLMSEHLGARDVCLLNFELGEQFADTVTALQAKAQEEGIDVDFVATHGHTLGHYPKPTHEKTGTLQIGEPALIAERTGLPVVSGFRARDMAAGGQGAPLVPYADWVLFRKPERTVACLNLGGIANWTVVTEAFEEVRAFDTGPCNMVIDAAMRQLSKGQFDYDQDGKTAAKGVIIDEFRDYLLSHRYYAKVPPKSTGREEFGAEVYLRDALSARREHGLEDLVATITHAVAQSICEAFQRFIASEQKVQQVIVGGGGARNKTLMKLLREGLDGISVFTTDQYGIPLGAREAIAFAILGNETIFGAPSNVPGATGARHPVVLGSITPA